MKGYLEDASVKKTVFISLILVFVFIIFIHLVSYLAPEYSTCHNISYECIIRYANPIYQDCVNKTGMAYTCNDEAFKASQIRYGEYCLKAEKDCKIDARDAEWRWYKIWT